MPSESDKKVLFWMNFGVIVGGFILGAMFLFGVPMLGFKFVGTDYGGIVRMAELPAVNAKREEDARNDSRDYLDGSKIVYNRYGCAYTVGYGGYSPVNTPDGPLCDGPNRIGKP